MTKNSLIAFLFICLTATYSHAEEVKIEKALYNHTPDSELIFEINI